MKPNKNTAVLSGDALVFASMLFFGSYSLFLRLHPLPVFSYLFAFQVVGAVAFIAWALVRKAKIRSDRFLIPYFAGLAVAATLNDLTYFYAFQLTTVAKAAISHQMVSVFLLVLAPLALKERTDRREWIAMVVALAGVILLFSDKNSGGSGDDALGVVLGLVSAFFYAWIIILYRKLQSVYKLSLTTINSWRYCLSALFLIPFIPIMARHSYGPEDIAVLAAFGVLFAVFASGIHSIGMGLTKALHSSIIGKSEPVFAVVYAFLFLKETPSLPVMAGGLIVLAVSLWLTLYKKPVAPGG